MVKSGDSMSCRKFISLAAISFLLTACAGQNIGTSDPAQVERDRQAAQEKLNRMMDAKRAAQERQSEAQRIADEKAAAAAAEAAKPHYDPTRLGIALKWRQWADITIPDINIHAWLKTNWKDGNMHLRLALLGDKTALRLFSGNWPYLRLVFADQQGNNLHQCILATRDLHWADGLRNSGTPTMEYEADSPVTLEVYESIVQWNLKWEDHLD